MLPEPPQQRRMADVRHTPASEARHAQDVPGLKIAEADAVLWAEHP
jgi:hypothetical protein